MTSALQGLTVQYEDSHFDFKEEDVLPLMTPTRELIEAILAEIEKAN